MVVKGTIFELGPGMTPCEGSGGGCNRVCFPPPLYFFFITDNPFSHLQVGAHNTKWDNHKQDGHNYEDSTHSVQTGTQAGSRRPFTSPPLLFLPALSLHQ